MVANGISVLLEFSHLLEVEIYIQTIYIWYWNQENSYLQVQYLNCFTKENREILMNVFKRIKKPKERAITLNGLLQLQMERHVICWTLMAETVRGGGGWGPAFKTTGWLQGRLSLSSFRGWISGNLVVKNKLPPRSGSSLDAVEPHPWKGAIKMFFFTRCISVVKIYELVSAWEGYWTHLL